MSPKNLYFKPKNNPQATKFISDLLTLFNQLSDLILKLNNFPKI